MKAAIRNRWVKALRSGAFEQGTGELHIAAADSRTGHSQYCCLGVLRRISGGAIRAQRGGEQILDATSCGISVADQTRLARLNDNGSSFETIANVIENTL